MRKNSVEDGGFTPEPQDSPVFRLGEPGNQGSPAETASRDMREIASGHVDALRRALDKAGFKMPHNA